MNQNNFLRVFGIMLTALFVALLCILAILVLLFFIVALWDQIGQCSG